MLRLLVITSLFVLTISFKCRIPLQIDSVKQLLGQRDFQIRMTINDGSNHENKLIPKYSAAYSMISRKSYISAAASVFAAIVAPLAAKAVGDRNEFVYIDKDNGFSVIKALGWSTMPQQPPSLTSQGPELEEAVFVASSFLEGASLTVTKVNARKLLKDNDIDWWFAPLTSMGDIGTADLISKLLSLHHQGAGEKRGLPERVFQATFVSDKEFENRQPPTIEQSQISREGVLTFEFNIPLAGTTCKTVAKAYFQNNVLMVIWLSALTSVWNGDYGVKLNEIKDSFRLDADRAAIVTSKQ